MRRTAASLLLVFTAAVLSDAAVDRASAQVQIEINRPRTPFDCDTPIGERWYGSEDRCLAELCGGQNVTNEYIFESDGRARRNPCYGRNPTSFEDD